ncbi:rhamnogalacturonan acetylesterase [Dysgonomonas sp. 511]|uniref:rhamnogalacturonan acetylesterase n=1 Tax=Dysgonomonas sp. 511 TaxID=2302930 RepID=UPI0013CF95AA|nr:rhamnogalacturonan acetylesterase [Dysgonomonas sp. 511]NDV77983.1 hypothetical protein [Dysgonomonas sp. 511]
MRKTALYILFLFCLSSLSNAQIRMLTIGDSTMADYDPVKNSQKKEKRGWGQMLPIFFDGNVQVDNAARNGRSSKSFYFEFWETGLRESLKPGDYVIIQFGHNDEKNNGADSDEADKKNRGTAPWSQYIKYLTKYVEESRAKGAIPILATPVVRRAFNADGKTLTSTAKHNLVRQSDIKNDSIMNYVLAMKSVARTLSVPLVDMTTLTEKLVIEYGPDKSKQHIYCEEDNTHLRALGGVLFARLFAEELARKNILKEHIVSSKETVLPKRLNFGSQLVSIPVVQAFTLVNVGIPGEKHIRLMSADPYMVSFYPDKEFSQLITADANGDFIATVYVKFTPQGAQEYNDALAFKKVLITKKKLSENTIEIPLSGSGLAADKDKVIEITASPAKTFPMETKPQVKGDVKAELKLQGLVAHHTTNAGLTVIENTDAQDLESAAREIDMNAARYAELAITANSYDIYLNHLSFSLKSESGDKMQFTVLGSADANFSKTDSFSVMENMSDKALKPYSFNTMIKIEKGKTYRLRLYPWNRGGSKNKIILDNVTIKGLGK